uniref:LIM zinc-binding domain-containing protein n=1 Tax=Salix viminalis TaxID=40686 RepID=A0A6N2KRF1_SALVM
MATFAGTTQKCNSCEKTVYFVDQLTADNKVYHKACFRCHHCKGTLKLVYDRSLSFGHEIYLWILNF